jgi:hypothetical protein
MPCPSKEEAMSKKRRVFPPQLTAKGKAWSDKHAREPKAAALEREYEQMLMAAPIGDYRLERQAVKSRRTKLSTIHRVLSHACSLCNDPLESIFRKRPNELSIRQALLMPCEECVDKVGEEELIKLKEKDSYFCANLTKGD